LRDSLRAAVSAAHFFWEKTPSSKKNFRCLKVLERRLAASRNERPESHPCDAPDRAPQSFFGLTRIVGRIGSFILG